MGWWGRTRTNVAGQDILGDTIPNLDRYLGSDSWPVSWAAPLDLNAGNRLDLEASADELGQGLPAVIPVRKYGLLALHLARQQALRPLQFGLL